MTEPRIIADDLGYELGLHEDPHTGLLVTGPFVADDGLWADEETDTGYITYD